MVVFAVAACGGAVFPAAPGVAPTAAEGADTSPTPAVSGHTQSAAPTTTASPSTADVSPAPNSRPTAKPVKMTDEERGLVLYLRDDAQVDCEPRRSNLPTGATAAVECLLGSALVDRVGVYGFDYDPKTAAIAYLERMDREGVLGIEGDCQGGTPRDASWGGPDGVKDDDESQVTYEGRIYSASRSGCFLNEHRIANFRATCGEGTYIGVLGNTAALDELSDWALRPPPGEMAAAGPGICFGTLGGGLDGPDTESVDDGAGTSTDM